MLSVLGALSLSLWVSGWGLQVFVGATLSLLALGACLSLPSQAVAVAPLVMDDSTSLLLVLLTVWLLPAYFVASHKSVYLACNRVGAFSLSVKSLSLFLLLAFVMQDSLLFYFFFEASLIPTFLLVLGWGYQPERLQAGLYLILYTLVGSLPLLLLILFLAKSSGSGSFFSFCSSSWWEGALESPYSGILSLGLGFSALMAFVVKLPMYGPHIWLPKAHVEAPVAGSMVLAGVLLKLGGYGIVRFMVVVPFSKLLSSILLSAGMWGGLLACFVCLVQVDVKALIAYSSVGHMSFVLGGLLSDLPWGLSGAVLTMVAHGLCSAGLFALSGYMYEMTGSRSVYLNKGGMVLAPISCLVWALFCCCNMSAPPSMNLLGELLVYPGVLSLSLIYGAVAAGMGFLAMAFSMYLFSSTQHGAPSVSASSSGFKAGPMLMLILFWCPLNLLILASGLFC